MIIIPKYECQKKVNYNIVLILKGDNDTTVLMSEDDDYNKV